MNLQWAVDQGDCAVVDQLIQREKDKEFFKIRIGRNVSGPPPEISHERIWKAFVLCLLTTQQRSGPGSAVMKFLCAQPFPLDLTTFRANYTSEGFAAVLRSYGGIRRSPTIANQLFENLQTLENGGWQLVDEMVKRLMDQRCREPQDMDKRLERDMAVALDAGFAGIGPKQARNFWQHLGLTRYEIPVDSRISKWLSRVSFPIALSANLLANADYYNIVLDGIQLLCKASGVLPCLLDAAVFASYDLDWKQWKLIN